MTLDETLTYIHSIHWQGSRPGLTRITALLRALGDPQEVLSFIHVAGTNGKGSFCAMMTAILRETGRRVGTFTSPYVRVFNERMAVNGLPISDDDLCRLTARVRPLAEAMADPPTEFELICAVAFLFFREQHCDVVVLEAGLGGRLDPTNVISRSLLSVITGVALDHTAYLGDTVEKIAAEKAGIIKPGCPVLFGGEAPGAAAVIRDTAKRLGAPYSAVDSRLLSVSSATPDGARFSFGELHDLRISLAGLYQPRNASVVLTAVSILQKQLPIPEEAQRRGLAACRWPARFEVLRRSPLVIFDGGHNPQGVAAAAETVRAYFPGRRLLVLSGVMQDKDYRSMAEEISKFAAAVLTVTPNNQRALDAEKYAGEFRAHGIPASAFASLAEGLRAGLRQAAAENRPLLILGSLYLYAGITALLENSGGDHPAE